MAIWNAVSTFTDWMWGNPLLILLVGGGIVLAFIIKGIQFRKFGFIWRNTVGTIFRKDGTAYIVNLDETFVWNQQLFDATH